MVRTVVAAAIALVAGALVGIGTTLAAVGLLSFAVGGTLNCTINGDGTVSSCTNDSGQQVKVPHHIHIKNPGAA